MRKYVIMGVQGSGKGTQAVLLRADLDLVHISVGGTSAGTCSSTPSWEPRYGAPWRPANWSVTTWPRR